MRLSRALLLAVALHLAPSAAGAAPSVWVIDDGEKIRRNDTSTPFESGALNPVWHPGAPVRLFAMRNESVAVQVVVEAEGSPLASVSVALGELDGPGGARMEEGCRPGGSACPIERFVEHFVVVRRASGGSTAGESLGWEEGSGPPAGLWVGPVPDALVPVNHAAPWVTYPMRIQPRDNGIVWVDLNVPRDAPPGLYRGPIEVRDGSRALATIPVELTVVDATLADRTVQTMLYYDPEELARRSGSGAEQHAWAMLHAHRIAPLHDATSEADVERQRAALDGTFYTGDHGYAGCAPGLGDGVLSVGAYGALGEPDDRALARVTAIAGSLAAAKLFETTEVFLYAADERCASPWGRRWRELLHGARDESVRRIRVGWTCSDDPESQPVDIAIVDSAHYVARRPGGGATAWVYNGVLPHSGTFLLDADAISPRVNGWLSVMFDVPRWFYWESTYWYGSRGATPMDPFVEPESLRNADGDWANGDGVLLYPGRQIDRFQEHSLGFDGVVASIRLKNWRRGIEDAGYLRLARAKDPVAADAVARRLIPAAFGAASAGTSPSWGSRGAPFFEARRALLAIALGEAAVRQVAHHEAPSGGVAPARSRWPPAAVRAVAALALAVGLFRWIRRGWNKKVGPSLARRSVRPRRGRRRATAYESRRRRPCLRA